MKKIDFLKMNGQGNDFILIDSVTKDIELTRAQIKNICDRHYGVGADGLILVKKSDIADFYMDFYNQDGSTAEMCGNGIRCMAAFIIYSNLSSKDNMNIETRAGIRNIILDLVNPECDAMPGFYSIDNTINGAFKVNEIKVNMGKPIFELKKIPFSFEENNDKNKIREKILNYPLIIENMEFNINVVSMGNPHCVIFLNEELDIDFIPIELWGPLIENHQLFPKKTNVEFIKKLNKDRIKMRVWERGVGETLACGTGACASAVCAVELGYVNPGCIEVILTGGILKIYWNGNNSDVFLEGTVQVSFKGAYFFE